MSKKGTKVKKNKRSYQFLTEKCSYVLNKRSKKNNFSTRQFLLWIKNQDQNKGLKWSYRFNNQSNKQYFRKTAKFPNKVLNFLNFSLVSK